MSPMGGYVQGCQKGKVAIYLMISALLCHASNSIAEIANQMPSCYFQYFSRIIVKKSIPVTGMDLGGSIGNPISEELNFKDF